MISLRPLTLTDINFLLEVRNLESTRKFLENDCIFSYQECKEWFLLKKPNWYIIEVNNQPVGYIRTSDQTDTSICIGCDIHESYRNKGYAKSAYHQIIKYYKNKNLKNIWLWVFEDNIVAHNLYKKLGFIDTEYKLVKGRKYVKMILNL